MYSFNGTTADNPFAAASAPKLAAHSYISVGVRMRPMLESGALCAPAPALLLLTLTAFTEQHAGGVSAWSCNSNSVTSTIADDSGVLAFCGRTSWGPTHRLSALIVQLHQESGLWHAAGFMVTPGAGRGMTYEFDYVFPPSAPTTSVYNALGSSIVQATLDGYNGWVSHARFHAECQRFPYPLPLICAVPCFGRRTIFAYGQTASVRDTMLIHA